LPRFILFLTLDANQLCMRKIVLAIILFSATFISYGQVIEKQQRILGGSAGFDFLQNQADNSASSDPLAKANTVNINLSPAFGKATKNNLVFGYQLYLNYAHSKSENHTTQDIFRSNGYGVGGGVFLEKFYPLSKSLSFSGYMPLSVTYGTNENTQWTNSNLVRTNKTKSLGAAISLSPSLNYSLNKKFLLQLSLNDFVSLGYTQVNTEVNIPNQTTEEQTSSNFGFSSRINYAKQLSNLSFGFSYIF
jgi:hypothetical protein